MPDSTPKWLDAAEHLAPYVTGGLLTVAAGVRWWWRGHKALQKRITNLEVIAENCVLKDDLIECKLDVDKAIEEKILPEISKVHERVTQQIKDDAIAHERLYSAMMAGDKT